MAIRIIDSADVAESATVGEGSSVWHLAQVREDAELGENCVIGRGAYIGSGVTLGDNCKVQNYALVYEPARLGRGVFVGPAVVFTNDHYPRAVDIDGSLKSADDWEPVGVTALEGCSVGARATCVAPVTLGKWSMIAAGAVVVNDVKDFSLVAGVPAKHIRWVGKAGLPLEDSGEGQWLCPKTGDTYTEIDGNLREGS